MTTTGTGEIKALVLQQAEKNWAALPEDFLSRHQDLVLTVVMLSHGRPDCTVRALQSLDEYVRIPYRVILLDNHSEPEVQAQLQAYCTGREQITLILLDENLGCGGGRMYALPFVETELVAFLDNDVEVFPGSIEHLLYQMERAPETVAVTGMCILPTGMVQYCGGDFTVDGGMLLLGYPGASCRFDAPQVGVSGPCRWVSGGVTLYRKRYLHENPYDPALRGYFEDIEWSYRVASLGEGRFQRCVEALFLHHHEERWRSSSLTSEEQHALIMPHLEALAQFYRRHDVVLQAIMPLLPEYTGVDHRFVYEPGRLLFILLLTNGREWFLTQWNLGVLAPLMQYPVLVQESHINAAHARSLSSVRNNLIRRLGRWGKQMVKSLVTRHCE